MLLRSAPWWVRLERPSRFSGGGPVPAYWVGRAELVLWWAGAVSGICLVGSLQRLRLCFLFIIRLDYVPTLLVSSIEP